MSDNATQNNAYKNMLCAVSNAIFIKLDENSDWLRIDCVDGTLDCQSPGTVDVHVRNENKIGEPQDVICISDIDPNKVKFKLLQEYSFSGVLMAVSVGKHL